MLGIFGDLLVVQLHVVPVGRPSAPQTLRQHLRSFHASRVFLKLSDGKNLMNASKVLLKKLQFEVQTNRGSPARGGTKAGFLKRWC